MKPKIIVFAGSTRTDSLNRKLAAVAAEVLREAGADVTLAELRKYPMPLYDGDLETQEGIPVYAKQFKELMRNQDGFVLATPEYNGSFPALVKNTIDWISRPEAGEKPSAVLRGKFAAIVSTSPGLGGGQRSVKATRELLAPLGVKLTAGQLSVPQGMTAFDGNGQPTRPEIREGVVTIAHELLEAIGAHKAAAA